MKNIYGIHTMLVISKGKQDSYRIYNSIFVNEETAEVYMVYILYEKNLESNALNRYIYVCMYTVYVHIYIYKDVLL